MNLEPHREQDHADSGASHSHEHDGLRYAAPGAEPTVFAARADVDFAPPLPAAEVRRQTEAFLRDLDAALAASGCVLVGHIKGILETSDQGRLTFSLTSLGEAARVADSLGADVGAGVLTINAIVFGVAEAAANAAVRDCWSARVTAATEW